MSRPKTSRRDFLKSSLALGAAGAAAACFSASAPAAGPSANDGVGVLAVGVRNKGGGDGAAAGKYGRVVACCDVDASSSDLFLKRIEKQQPFPPAIYKDYRKALERKDVDVVTIGTPDHWHTAILIAALRAGKDVYCEKPMTLTIDEGKKILRAAEETGRVVQVGTQQRSEYNQAFLKAVAIAQSGRLGKRLTATCMIGQGRAGGPFSTTDPPATLDWDFWLGQAPKVPYTKERCHGSFRSWFEYSGGKMTDWGAHHVDIAQWAIGADHTGPVEIAGEGLLPLGREATLAMLTRHLPLPNSYSTAVTFKIRLAFANGNTIVVTDGPDNGILIEGDKGRIFVSRGNRSAGKLTGKPVEEIEASAADRQWLADEVIKLYQGKQPTTHMANFIQCVKERGRPISDVWTHHRSVSSCHLCNIALLTGRKLTWDPEKEDFPGDAEASSLLAREQRRPYTIEA
jgi:predicted dehydrogenase